MNKVTLKEKFNLLNQYWTPKILGELNGNQIKIFKAKGEFVWHQHENEDEFFLVIEGQLKIKLKDREIVLNEGDFFIVPKGTEHLPYSDDVAHVLLFEPENVLNTGDAISEKSVEEPEWL